MLHELLCALRLDGLERHAVNARRSVVLLGHRVRLLQRFHLAHVNV
jgi:hypothetical protein